MARITHTNPYQVKKLRVELSGPPAAPQACRSPYTQNTELRTNYLDSHLLYLYAVLNELRKSVYPSAFN